MEIYRNWLAIMDLTARQIYREVGQPTLGMFIYLSLTAANGTCQSSTGKSLPICRCYARGKIGLFSWPQKPCILKNPELFSGNLLLSFVLRVFFEAILNGYDRDIFWRGKGCGFIWIDSFFFVWRSSCPSRRDDTFPYLTCVRSYI